MIWVCNTGPVIALAKIGRLDLLRQLGESVRIPETVFHELLGKPGEDFRLKDAETPCDGRMNPALRW